MPSRRGDDADDRHEQRAGEAGHAGRHREGDVLTTAGS